jgi:hypothetical protein
MFDLGNEATFVYKKKKCYNFLSVWPYSQKAQSIQLEFVDSLVSFDALAVQNLFLA